MGTANSQQSIILRFPLCNPSFFLIPDMSHTTWRTLSRRLNEQHPAMKLFHKAKRLGTWNPDDLDFTQDRADWDRLSLPERDLIRMLAALFMAGEEAVTLDLLPLLKAIAEGGHLEEELYLTTFLWEEAKHVDFFNRFFREVTGEPGDLHHYQGESYRLLFGEVLPGAMGRLYADPSPLALAEASVVYNMIVEGVLAETGYHAWYTLLERHHLLPGTVAGIALLQRDEARHIRYGVFLLSRLIAEQGPSLWQAIQTKLSALLPVALEVFVEGFMRLEATHGAIPFGLDLAEFTDFAAMQFQKRYARLEKAVGQPLQNLLSDEPTTEETVTD
jgi:ribonucleoside-diphosphate reductase beta chain